jgi:transcriptional regulator with XRE-family HTH domain
MNSEQLKQWRKSQNLTQQALADWLEIPQSTIARWESKFCKIQHPKILGLALKQIENEQEKVNINNRKAYE